MQIKTASESKTSFGIRGFSVNDRKYTKPRVPLGKLLISTWMVNGIYDRFSAKKCYFLLARN
jgi:hypothetical protein